MHNPPPVIGWGFLSAITLPDKLRRAADFLEQAGGSESSMDRDDVDRLAERLYEQESDVFDEIGDVLRALAAENAELRESRDYWKAEHEIVARDLMDAEQETVKLREAARRAVEHGGKLMAERKNLRKHITVIKTVAETEPTPTPFSRYIVGKCNQILAEGEAD